MRNRLIKDKAMTLAEILVCMFILALVAIIILPGLLYGQQQVYESGNRNTKIYKIQQELEEEMAAPGADATPATLEIQFGSKIFEVEGQIIEKEEAYDSRGSKTKAKVFVPTQQP